jgi:hypothetical protein
MLRTGSAPEAAPETLESDVHPDDAERRAAEAQHDDTDLPERPVVVPERKVEAVSHKLTKALEFMQPGE